MPVTKAEWEKLGVEKKTQMTRELFSADVPWGLYNVVPESMQKALHLIDPRWMSRKEETVTKHADPTERDELFRFAFWAEYNHAKDTESSFNMSRVMSGVCSLFYYKNNILKNPRVLAYVVYPPTNYLNFMKTMLYRGQQRLKEIMSVSSVTETEVVDKKGKKSKKIEVDMKLANMQLKTFALIDNRVKGAIVQRVKVEQKNLNVNVDAKALKDATPESVIDIDKQLRAIDRDLRRSEEIMKVRAIKEHQRENRGRDAEAFDVIEPVDIPDEGDKH